MASSDNTLRAVGAVVVPLFPPAELTRANRRLQREIDIYPEYNCVNSIETPRVLGGFGAFGNPSSFHSPIVRDIRAVALPVARRVFAQAYADSKSPPVLEQLFDRVCLRTAGTKIPPESWHRDITPPQVKLPSTDGKLAKNPTKLPVEEAQVFGGWINLNKPGQEAQQFIFVPGSHISQATSTTATGFAPIAKEDHRELDAASVTLDVPPGHLLIFFQHIVHKVAPVTYKNSSLRLFTSWRLGGPMNPFFGEEYSARIITNFESPVIPSGQRAPLYSANCLSIRNKKTVEWSKRAIHKSLLVQITPTKRSNKSPYTIAPRFLISLPKSFRKQTPLFFSPYSKYQLQALAPRFLSLNKQ